MRRRRELPSVVEMCGNCEAQRVKHVYESWEPRWGGMGRVPGSERVAKTCTACRFVVREYTSPAAASSPAAGSLVKLVPEGSAGGATGAG